MRTALLLCSLLSTAFALADLGMPGWSCSADLMKKSESVPQSVHSLRPADIEIVGALGDSLTAGNGAGANPGDILGVGVQYRGLSFSVGGDKTLDDHVTMANVLKKFNPDVFGYSVRTGAANIWDTAKLNAAIPNAHSFDMATQANDLVKKLKDHPEIDYKNQWKLIHIFVGAMDLCNWCVRQDSSSDAYRDNIRAAVQVLQKELPKTIVVLTGMMDITLLRKVDADHAQCGTYHEVECQCEQFGGVPDDVLSDEARLYSEKEQELQDSGEFDTADDFTLVLQPFFEGVTDVARNPDGTVNMDFYAPDCFHFSQYGHAVTAKNLWNNMMQPVGSKTRANFTDAGIPLLCPEPSCPFIRTTKNSVDCGKYMTA